MLTAELIIAARSSAADGVKPFAEFSLPVGYQPSVKYCRTSAASPAAPGVAMLVPDSDCVPQLFVKALRSLFAEMMPEPGTVISGLMRPSAVGPQLLNEAMELALVLRRVAPTERPLLAVDGLPTDPVPGPELPAANRIRKSL
jgi:hypothetical protein